MIVTNAKVLTMDPANPRAEAVALDADKIVAVGTRAEVEALATPGSKVIDAKGRILLPGFFESHLHLVLGGAELMQLQLGGGEGTERARCIPQLFRSASGPARRLRAGRRLWLFSSHHSITPLFDISFTVPVIRVRRPTRGRSSSA
jgi:predicted amidohydrolase YtcJ